MKKLILLGLMLSFSLASFAEVRLRKNGDVKGPAAGTSTDNAIVRWDGTTGKVIQNSGVTIDDSNNVTIPTTSSLSMGAAGVKLSGDSDGAITLLGLGDGSDEDLTVNLDDTANTIVFSSSTGVTDWTLTGFNLIMSDNATIGLPSGIKMEFDDQTSDEVNFVNGTNQIVIGIGTSTPAIPFVSQASGIYILGPNGNQTAAIALAANDGAGAAAQTYEIISAASGAFGLYDRTDSRYALYIDTSGNFGVGKDITSPGAKMHVSTDDASNASVTEVSRIEHTTSGAPAANIGVSQTFFVEDAGGSELQADIQTQLSTVTDGAEDADLIMRVNDSGTMTEYMRFDASDNSILTPNSYSLQLGSTGVRITNDADGAITFLGTSAGADEDLTINLDDTANSAVITSSTGVTNVDLGTIDVKTDVINLGETDLSVYQEGTFTPTVTLVGGAGNTVPVYSTNTGRYTRIGNQVFVDVYLTGDGGNEGAGTGRVNIALPVTASASHPTSFFPCGYSDNGGTEREQWGQIAGSATTIELVYFTTLGDEVDFTGADQNNTTRTIRLKFNYEV